MNKKFNLVSLFVSAGLLVLTTISSNAQDKKTTTTQKVELDRTSLPIKTPARQTTKELDVRNVTQPVRVEVKAPEGAPNVILVLLDDLGFAGTSAFGGWQRSPASPLASPPDWG